MTEVDWLHSRFPQAMLNFLNYRISDRKVRLFMTAMCRAVWDSLIDVRSRCAVDVAERFADGAATEREMDACNLACYHVVLQRGLHNDLAARYEANQAAAGATAIFAGNAEYLRTAAYYTSSSLASAVDSADWTELYPNEARHAALLRHIAGNPFRRPSAIAVSPLMQQLAAAVYAGDAGAVNPLRDILLEADLEELANHFTTSDHPKGCWAIDLILGKS